METLLKLLIFSPIVGLFFIIISWKFFPNFSGIISTLCGIVNFILTILILKSSETGNFVIYDWISISETVINIEFSINQLSKGMLFIVSLVGLCVQIFSLNYMSTDSAKPRYFGALCFFIFSMYGIILSGNLFMMFVFWELVGISSYVLIGHWFSKNSASDASKKAFLTNKLGDFGFLTGILLIWTITGTFNFEILETFNFDSVNSTLLTIITLCIFLGAVGKSAQFPLHVWLPDAMEGPTPVSALIHAATMVAAGVFMLAKVFFLILAAPLAGEIISWIGGITALMSALIATQQNDIKRILAYSTLSQLGYMVMAMGVGAKDASIFHLYNHAFFKALLFLCAGAIIHNTSHLQDIWKMGGLKIRQISVFLLFFIAMLSLIGFPFLSGFYSKGIILESLYYKNKVLYGFGIVSAFLTSFYMIRLFVIVFLGPSRTKEAANSKNTDIIMLIPMIILAIFSIVSAFSFIAEPGKGLGLSPAFPKHGDTKYILLVFEILAIFLGIVLAYIFYNDKKKEIFEISFIKNKFYIDEVYGFIIKNIQGSFAVILWALEKLFIEVIAQNVIIKGGSLMLGDFSRRIQNGKINRYIIIFCFGLLFILLLLILKFRS